MDFNNSSNIIFTNNYITNNKGYGVSVRNSDITIEHSTAPSEYWIGGSAPGSGDGGTSNVDIYTFNILKNGNNSYIVIGNHIKTS